MRLETRRWLRHYRSIERGCHPISTLLTKAILEMTLTDDNIPDDEAARKAVHRQRHNDLKKARRLANPEKYREKDRLQTANYRGRNREKVRAIDKKSKDNRSVAKKEHAKYLYRQWKDNNRDHVNAYMREWYLQNIDKVTEKVKLYRAKRPEWCRAVQRRWRAMNRERSRYHQKTWRQNNPEKVNAAYRVGHASRRGAPGSFTAKDIINLRKIQNDRCAYCNVSLHGKGHVDHIMPIARGGSNYKRNLQLTCAPCNQSKSDRDPVEFAQSLGFLI